MKAPIALLALAALPLVAHAGDELNGSITVHKDFQAIDHKQRTLQLSPGMVFQTKVDTDGDAYEQQKVRITFKNFAKGKEDRVVELKTRAGASLPKMDDGVYSISGASLVTDKKGRGLQSFDLYGVKTTTSGRGASYPSTEGCTYIDEFLVRTGEQRYVDRRGRVYYRAIYEWKTFIINSTRPTSEYQSWVTADATIDFLPAGTVPAFGQPDAQVDTSASYATYKGSRTNTSTHVEWRGDCKELNPWDFGYPYEARAAWEDRRCLRRGGRYWHDRDLRECPRFERRRYEGERDYRDYDDRYDN